jgi:hypothetical protein
MWQKLAAKRTVIVAFAGSKAGMEVLVDIRVGASVLICRVVAGERLALMGAGELVKPQQRLAAMQQPVPSRGRGSCRASPEVSRTRKGNVGKLT